MIPYIISERNQNKIEVNTDFIAMHHSRIILLSVADYSVKVKKSFADLIQGKSLITLRDRSDIFFEQDVRSVNDSFKYKLTKHDNMNTHGIAYNTDQESYVFDWKGEGLIKSLTKYLSVKQYLPVTEDIVERVLYEQLGCDFIVEQCDIYTSHDQLKNVGVWYVDTNAFRQYLEQIDMESDDGFEWDEIIDMSDYLVTFADPIKERLNRNIEVLYNPSKVDQKMLEARQPYEGQIPTIQAGIEALNRKDNRFIYLAARQGSGKTTMTIKMNHSYHYGKGKQNYVTLVTAPAIILSQWKDELEANIADDINIFIIKDTNQFIKLYNQTGLKFDKPTYLLVGKETFKLSYPVKHGIIPKKRKDVEICLCPDCGKPLKNPLRKNDTVYFTENDFNKPKKSNYKCSECGSILFQASYNKTKKTSIANFIQKKNAKFDAVIVDEMYQSNNSSSIIGKTTRDIMKQAKKVILMSGTISNGYASSIYNVLFALMPNALKKDNVFDKDEFVKAYGTLLGKEKVKDSDLYKSDRIEVKDFKMQEIEGINPLVYTRYFSESFIFCELEDIRSDLPELIEEYVPISMSYDHKRNEQQLVEDIEKANAYHASFYKDSVVKHYTNNPFNWNEIPFLFKKESGKQDRYVQPVNMGQQLLPKEEKLIELCKKEKENGRKTWVYLNFVTNGKYAQGESLQNRLARLLEESGLRVFVLRGTTKPVERKKIIESNKDKHDIFISHPSLVSVGINLQWCTHYIFYTPSYRVNTVRQSMLRGRRINSTQENIVRHLYYNSGVEKEVMDRYKLKRAESEAIENRFIEVSDGQRTASGLGAKIEKSLKG